jgi:hypothetical protein
MNVNAYSPVVKLYIPIADEAKKVEKGISFDETYCKIRKSHPLHMQRE